MRHLVNELGIGRDLKREGASTSNYLFFLEFLLENAIY